MQHICNNLQEERVHFLHSHLHSIVYKPLNNISKVLTDLFNEDLSALKLSLSKQVMINHFYLFTHYSIVLLNE